MLRRDPAVVVQRSNADATVEGMHGASKYFGPPAGQTSSSAVEKQPQCHADRPARRLLRAEKSKLLPFATVTNHGARGTRVTKFATKTPPPIPRRKLLNVHVACAGCAQLCPGTSRPHAQTALSVIKVDCAHAKTALEAGLVRYALEADAIDMIGATKCAEVHRCCAWP